MKKGWREITDGADIAVPNVYKFIIKFITPLMLIVVFLGAVFAPLNNDWTGNLKSLFSGNGWSLSNTSIIKTISQSGLKEQIAAATNPAVLESLNEKMFYISMARIFLIVLFIFISILVYLAYKKRVKEGRATL